MDSRDHGPAEKISHSVGYFLILYFCPLLLVLKPEDMYCHIPTVGPIDQTAFVAELKQQKATRFVLPHLLQPTAPGLIFGYLC